MWHRLPVVFIVMHVAQVASGFNCVMHVAQVANGFNYVMHVVYV